MSFDNINSTERYEESINDISNRTKVKKHKTKKVTIDLNEMASFGRSRDLGASVESLDSLDTGQPKRTARDDVLESLGYKSNRIPKPNVAGQQIMTTKNLCHYCGRRVYPMEKIDIGEMYHKGCFKCNTCGLQLTLKTFCKVSSDKNEIYCKSHVPKLGLSYDREAMEIQAAIRAQRKASEKVIKQFEPSPNKYDPDAIEFRHARDLKKRKLVRRRSLKTTADFQKFGVFEAQEELERKHRREEDKLYQEMNEERNNQIKNLETYLAKEKERTVKELIAWFEGQKTSEEEQKSGLQKIEQYYKEQRERKIKELLDKMHFEEQEAVTRLTEKHAQEMLLMIEQRDKEVTEEYSRHKPQFSRRLSYKEMQCHEDKKATSGADDDEDDNIDESLENIDEEELDEELGDGDDDNEGDAAHDNEDDDAKQTDNLATRITDLELSDSKKLIGNKKVRRTSGGDGNFELEVEGKKYLIRKDDPKYFLPSTFESSTEHSEDLTSKKTKKEKIRQKKHVTYDESVITEEIYDKKQKSKSQGRGQDDTNYREVKTGKEVLPDSQSTIIAIERNEEIINKRKPKSKDISETVQNQQYKEQTPLVVEEEDEDDEEETIEDRIKKVLKKNNVRVSLPDKDSEKETTQVVREKDKNIWRGSGFSRENESLNKSSDLSKSSLRPVKNAVRSTENRSDKHVHISRSTEKLDNSDETQKSDEDYTPRMSVPPSVEPPVCRKSKLYKDPEIFREFDENAFEEAKRDPTSFTDLLRRLSYKCKNDLQKVRAIFRWITAKDLNKMEFSKDVSSNTPMGLLRGIKSGTETYHNLFKRLCSYVGIHCKIINGFSKGVGYRPGSKFRDNKFRNQWTAVWIKDSWRFINCNWGARHVKQQSDLHLTYKIDEFYFLTDPEDHIQQHFPDDPRWQMLRKPITIEEFIRMPVVKSPFFNNKLEFTSKTESILKASHDGTVELCIRSPSLMSFAAKLQSKDNSIMDEQLSRQCLIRMVNDCTIFRAVLPQHGRYYWDIFVDKRWNSRSLDNACSFLIYCPQLPNQNIVSFPSVCFGQMPESDSLGLKIIPEFDPFLKIKEEVQLDLNLKSKSNIKTSISMQYISQQDLKEVDCSQYVTILSRTKSCLTCFLRCPKKGHYIMNLLATDKSLSSNKAVPIYKFFVDCQSPSDKTKFLAHTTSRFKDCRLIEPLDGELVVNSNICFRIESSSAFEILVSVNDTWFSLQNIDNLWQGIINTGPKVGKAIVFGRFKKEDDKYIPFVEYFIKEPSMAEEVHALFKYMN